MVSSKDIYKKSFFSFPLYVMLSSISDNHKEVILRDSKVLVFDIEGTLFHKKNPLFEQEKEQARNFYKDKRRNDSPPDVHKAYRKHLSLSKLIYKECGVPHEEYWALKGTLDYEGYLKPNEHLRHLLLKAKEKYKPVVWSNNSYEITARILKLIRIEDVFDVIFYAKVGDGDGHLQKPIREANELLIKLLNLDKPENIVLFHESRTVVDSARCSEMKGICVDNICTSLEEFILTGEMCFGLFSIDTNVRIAYGKDEYRGVD